MSRVRTKPTEAADRARCPQGPARSRRESDSSRVLALGASAGIHQPLWRQPQMVQPLLRRRIQGGRLSFRGCSAGKNWSGANPLIRPKIGWHRTSWSRRAIRKRQKGRRNHSFSRPMRILTRARQKSESKSSGLFGNGQPACISAELSPVPLVFCFSPFFGIF